MVSLVAGIGFCQIGGRGWGQYYNKEDGAPALRVHNTGDEVVEFRLPEDNSSAVLIVFGNSPYTTNTLDLSGTSIDTIAELASNVANATNSAGKKPLKTDTDCVVATSESCDEELLLTTNTISAGNWGTGFFWDTSDTKHFNAYIPSSDHGASRGGAWIRKIYGDIGGTGNITLTINVDGSQRYQRTIVSPRYVLAATASTNTAQVTASDEIWPGILDIPFDFYIGAKEDCLIQALRASSGTTGGLGVHVEFQ